MFINKALLVYRYTHLYTASDCFCMKATELSSWDRDLQSAWSKIFTTSSLIEKKVC